MRRVFLAFLLLGFAVPALAVGRVTNDPNAPGAKPDDEVVQAADKRLARPVTIEAVGKPVRLVLAELTKSSGVVLNAGRGSYDWQVRDRKMNVFARKVPLAQLMNSISHVMKFKWERKGEPGKWAYRLYMDRRTLLNAEAQRAREEARQAEERKRWRQKALDAYVNLGSLSDQEKAGLRDTNPFLYVVANAGWGQSLGAFLQEVPAISDALTSGQQAQVEGASLSPSGRAGLLNAMLAELAFEARADGSHRTTPLPDKLDPAEVTVTVNHHLDNVPAAAKHAFLGEIRFSYKQGSVGMPFVNPDSELVKFMGKLLLEAELQDRTMDEAGKERETEIAAIMTKEVVVQAGGEPVNEHGDDPSLKAKVKLQPDSPALFNVQLDLAQASGLCVVSDHFPVRGDGGGMPQQGPPSGEVELKTALDRIAEIHVYNWDKRDGVLEFRDRNWFRKRANQIPDAWIEKWRDELKATGTLSIDSLSQVAQLTQEQYSANLLEDDVFTRSTLIGIATAHREPLRFYASLNSDQRDALFGAGIDLGAISADQSEALLNLLKTRSGKPVQGSRSMISCVRREVEKRTLYTFRLSVDGRLAEEWNVGTPHTWPQPERDNKKNPPPPETQKPAG